MSILINEERKLFLISTADTSYGFEISAAGVPQNLHWGARIDAPEDLPYGETWQYNVDTEPAKKLLANQEYPPQGGYFFDEPCLKVMFANGCRDTKLFYQGYHVEKSDGMETLVIDLQEEVYPLKVRLFYRVYDGLNVLDRWSEIENTGDEPIQLESVQSAAFYLPTGKDYRFSHMAGKWAGEYQLERHALTQSKSVVQSRHGISGHDSCPWFAIDEGGRATEESGRVWAGGVHWSGNWKIVAETDREDRPRVTLGINDFDFGWNLKPGEVFTAPKATVVYSETGFGGASLSFHRYQLDYLMPQNKAHKIMPVSYNSWGVFEFSIDEGQQMKLAEKAAKAGVDLFIMDDGWFGARDNDHAGLGDWYPSRTKFPNGLDPLIEHVNKLGMQFGIWVEPEAVNPDSDLYRAHPEWVLRPEGKPITTWRKQYVLNFAREDVCDYAWNFLEELLANHNIAYLKWDMNRYLCEVGWPEKPVCEQREVWTRFVYNVYKLFDRIQERFPDVLVENCAGGGARVDLGMVSRADFVNQSDNGDPLDNLKIFEGYTQLFPARTEHLFSAMSERWDKANAENDFRHRVARLNFRRNQCSMTSIGMGDNLLNEDDASLEKIHETLDFYRKYSHLTQLGDLYRLQSIYDGEVAAYEFASREGDEAVVFVYSLSIQFYPQIKRVKLRGLKPDAVYCVNGGECYSGRALMQIGVEPELHGDFDSAVFHVRQIGGCEK